MSIVLDNQGAPYIHRIMSEKKTAAEVRDESYSKACLILKTAEAVRKTTEKNTKQINQQWVYSSTLEYNLWWWFDNRLEMRLEFLDGIQDGIKHLIKVFLHDNRLPRTPLSCSSSY